MSVGGPAVSADGPCVAAKVALVDPLLTLSVPQRGTASTGMDVDFPTTGVQRFSSVRPKVFEHFYLFV
jgi:hypothetical protein